MFSVDTKVGDLFNKAEMEECFCFIHDECATEYTFCRYAQNQYGKPSLKEFTCLARIEYKGSSRRTTNGDSNFNGTEKPVVGIICKPKSEVDLQEGDEFEHCGEKYCITQIDYRNTTLITFQAIKKS